MSQLLPERKIDISKPSLDEVEWLELKETLLSGWITQGPKVAEFENKFASYHNAKHAIAVTSCTTGLHLALMAMGIKPGDEVIVPSFTWVATANAALYCGATPVLVDVDPKTYNIDTNKITERISSKTKAIIPVHLFGQCADIDSIKKIVPENVFILEDAACAVGSSLNGKFAGTLGDAAVFSFHPRKIITTGEGGIITTNNSELAKAMEIMRNHGASISEEQRHHGNQPFLLPEFDVLGFNYRMTDIQGTVGITQLSKLSKLISMRQHWASYYKKELCDIEWLQLPDPKSGFEHSWQSYVCYIDEKKAPMSRNQIMKQLQKKGISSRPGTHSIHNLSFYKQKYGFNSSDFPVSRDCANFTMAIPLHNQMTNDDFEYVVQEIKRLGR